MNLYFWIFGDIFFLILKFVPGSPEYSHKLTGVFNDHTENAVLYSFHLISPEETKWSSSKKYCCVTEEQNKQNNISNKYMSAPVTIEISANVVSHGKMKTCKKALIKSGASESEYLIKIPNNEKLNNPTAAIVEVVMQTYAKHWASLFNSLSPPQKLDFIDSSVIQLVDRPGKPVYVVESYMGDQFEILSDFYGNAVTQVAENVMTIAAFNHFVWEGSKNNILFGNLQGTSNLLLTHPQVHSKADIFVGASDENIFQTFISNHACNSICKQLQLTPFKDTGSEEDRKKRSSTVRRISNSYEKLMFSYPDLCK